MRRQSLAKWTVMIYANGNNELQTEMWQCKLAAEQVGSSEKVNVVLQISQEKRELAEFLRPQDTLPDYNRKWIGARRYLLMKGKSVLVKDLGKINMADPMNLYKFMVWAVSEYPSEHYMLILGGHAYQFVGVMTDYSQNEPYIMGIPEMNRAIELAAGETDSKIDILVMDSCYYNFIEVMYEMGKNTNPAVQHVLTYIDNGPIPGLAYDKLLSIVQENSQNPNAYELCCALLSSFPVDLVAVRIDHVRLSHIKELFHSIAQCYEKVGYEQMPNLYGVIYSSQPTHPWYEMVMEMHAASRELIIGAREVSASGLRLLHVATKPTEDKASLALYGRLSFTHSNDWLYLLSNRTFRIEATTGEIELRPLCLGLGDVATYISIMNPTISYDEKLSILTKLCQYKKWLFT